MEIKSLFNINFKIDSIVLRVFRITNLFQKIKKNSITKLTK